MYDEVLLMFNGVRNYYLFVDVVLVPLNEMAKSYNNSAEEFYR